ncbi:MAG: hypothetical protein KC635_28935, partial [Myxococcales bacterium]|nr:hypothetical protein [Myxococcales bacterium]
FGTDNCGNYVEHDCGRDACGAAPTKAEPWGPSGSATVCHDNGYRRYIEGLHELANLPTVDGECHPPTDFHYCPNNRTDCLMWCPATDGGVPNTGGCP